MFRTAFAAHLPRALTKASVLTAVMAFGPLHPVVVGTATFSITAWGLVALVDRRAVA